MKCSPFDVRDYFWEELGKPERVQVEAHLAECQACREELGRLRSTDQMLRQLKEEEIPRRIAFVSDKVFEPSRAARWWAGLTQGVPRFALSAALLLAVFFFGAWMTRPSISVDKGHWEVAFGSRDAQVEQAVNKAVSTLEAKQASERRNLEEAYDLLIKQMNILYQQSSGTRAAYRQ